MSPIETIMRKAPVIPVLVIDEVAHAAPIAEALVKGGLPVLEVTLRTASALEVIREMKQVPGAIVGAGTVLNEHALEDALEAGSEFIVSPGFTESPMTAGAFATPGLANAFTKEYPLGRLNTSEDIARAALWVSSDECFMSGQNFQVNGGLTLRRNPRPEEIGAAVASAMAGAGGPH